MNYQKLTAVICCAAAMTSSVFAAETKPAAAKPAPAAKAAPAAKPAPAAKAAPAAPKQSADQLLAWIPKNIAIVNGKPIPGSTLKKIMKPQLENAIAQGQTIPEQQVRMFAYFMTERLVINELLLEEAAKAGYKPDKAACEKRLAEIKQQMGEERFKQQLAQSGATEAELIDEMIKIQTIEDYIMSQVKVTDGEVRQYYDKNLAMFTNLSASHILAMFPSAREQKPATDAEKKQAMAKIKKAQAALKSGKPFADVAKEFSDCPSKDKGGDLGIFQPGQMVPEFENALKKLKPGQVSDIVETPFGYHIIKAGNTEVLPFEKVKGALTQELKQEKAGQILAVKSKLLSGSDKAKILISKPQVPSVPPAATKPAAPAATKPAAPAPAAPKK